MNPYKNVEKIQKSKSTSSKDALKEFVRSFSEAIAEGLKGTGVSVTVLCPGPTATGFEQAAEMKNSKMFTFFKPATAKEVAEAGYKALM